MRRLALAAALALLAPLAQAADAPAAETFDARCARLPPSRFDVAEVPVSFVENDTQSIDELTLRNGDSPDIHMTFGLTTVSFGYDADIEIGAVEETQTRRVCGNLDLHVRLSMQPVVVYLAQELGVSPCARTATREHEMKHLAVFEQTLAEATQDLRSELPAGMGAYVRRAGTREELERTMTARVKEYLSGFTARWRRVLDERQAAVDSPEETLRVKSACPITG